MRRFHHSFRRFCALVIGLVFFLSGMLKLMDPVGTGLKVAEYFRFLHLAFLVPFGKVTGVAISLLESLVGAALVSGIARKLTAVTVLVMVGFFTGLTLALYLVNPDMDCGCFGEAIRLTHFQSMLKNIILLVLALVAFIPLSDGFEARNPKKWGFALVAAFILFFAMSSWRGLPLMDFTAYAPGSQILSASGAAADPAEENPAVLSFSDAYGEYGDDLASEGEVLVLSVYEPEQLDSLRWAKMATTVSDAFVCGIRPLVLSPSAESVPMTLGECLFFADPKTLLTLNRSNGGATFLSDGLIVTKWPFSRLPAEEDLTSLLKSEPVEVATSVITWGRLAYQGSLLLCIALMILL